MTKNPRRKPRAGDPLDADAIRRTLQALVRIDSVNPGYGGPRGGERRALECAWSFLKDAGVAARLVEFAPGRFNLLARVEGRGDAPPLLFESHIDTVSTRNMTIEPLGAQVENGRLWGRGATDAKGQGAALLHALAACAAAPHPPERAVELALVSGEELDFCGARALLEAGITAGGIVIGEPTALRLVTAHKGTVRIWIRVEGKSAHGATPHLGVNAITMAAALVEAIDQEYAPELARRRAELLDPPTINVGIIEGGLQANLVPPLCRIHLDRRLIPGEDLTQFAAELEVLLARLRRRNPDFKAEIEPPTLVAGPVSTDPACPLARRAAGVLERRGLNPEPVGVDYATDAAILAESGVPIVILGAGSIAQAHTADEFVELEQVAAAAAIYAELMAD